MTFQSQSQSKCVICPNGSKYWILSNKYHRMDGLALKWADGSKKWYFNGKLHCECGPATRWDDNSMSWYIYGKLLRPEEAIKNGSLRNQYPKLIEAMEVHLAIHKVHND